MDNIVIVTGAGNGIGAGTAKVFGANGYKVAVLDLKIEDAEKTANEIVKNGGAAIAIKCDVSLRKDVEAAIDQVTATYGLTTTLINNAGVGGAFHKLDEVTDEEWDWVVNTNMRSVFMFCRNLLPKMKEVSFGRIVNVSSVQGLFGSPRSSTYVATKHAIVGYTKTIAAEWGEYNITCNAICPGYVQTSMGIHDDMFTGFTESVMKLTPAKMIASPEETGQLIYQIARKDMRYLNGAVIPFDGGITCYTGVTDFKN
ncbi:MAG: SDR family oxidoreductase [Clostridia bacterium]